MVVGTHESVDDPRNESILIYVNGDIVPRAEAKVSVYDSGFMLGDGVWEGLRLHNGRLLFEDLHLARLHEAAKAIDLGIGMSVAELKAALYCTVAANHMHDGAHLRLMVTRGIKKTPFQQTTDADRFSGLNQLDKVESVSEVLVACYRAFEDIVYCRIEISDLLITDIF